MSAVPALPFSTVASLSRSAATVIISASSRVVAVVVAAADETSHAEARLAKPSQASQSREGLTNGIGYICDQAQGAPDHNRHQYQISPMT